MPAQTTLTVRHRYSLRVDRGNLKRLTPTKVGDAVAKQPMAKGKVKVVGTISSAYMYGKKKGHPPLISIP